MAKSSGDTSKLELVELALAGIDAQIKELTDKKAELMALVGQAAPAAPKRAAKAKAKAAKVSKVAKVAKVAKSEADADKKKRVFSAATRKKLREAAKARWARAKEAKTE
jgi:hypothetical protein